MWGRQQLALGIVCIIACAIVCARGGDSAQWKEDNRADGLERVKDGLERVKAGLERIKVLDDNPPHPSYWPANVQMTNDSEYNKMLDHLFREAVDGVDQVCRVSLMRPPNQNRFRKRRILGRNPKHCELEQWFSECPDVVKKSKSKLLVIARKHQNTSWASEVGVPYIVYNRGDPREPGKYILGDMGNEAGIYLRFIVDCWDHLPENIAFLHGHYSSWHNSGIVPIPRHLRWGAHPYVNLNYIISDDFTNVTDTFVIEKENLPGDTLHQLVSRIWSHLFQSVFGDQPNVIPAFYGAQFAVRRESIYRLPRSFFLQFYIFLMQDAIGSHEGGWIGEAMWMKIMLGDAEYPKSLCDIFICEGNKLKKLF